MDWIPADNLDMDDEKRNEHNNLRAMHYERILKKGSIYAQPFSEGNSSAAGKSAFGTTALRTDKGWIINGKKYLHHSLVMQIIMVFCAQNYFLRIHHLQEPILCTLQYPHRRKG